MLSPARARSALLAAAYIKIRAGGNAQQGAKNGRQKFNAAYKKAQQSKSRHKRGVMRPPLRGRIQPEPIGQQKGQRAHQTHGIAEPGAPEINIPEAGSPTANMPSASSRPEAVSSVRQDVP